MNSAVMAAIIAAGVSFLTLLGTLAAQFYGIRKASSGAEETLRQERDRTLNERFAMAADKLGTDKPASVRLAGVYAMAGLADDWRTNRQTCVDVLCGYLRMPYSRDPGAGAPVDDRLAFESGRQVRLTVIRVITDHLQPHLDDTHSWRGLNFDFTGAVFDGGRFQGAHFTGGKVRFHDAEFAGGKVRFSDVVFSGSDVSFHGARFSGGEVRFHRARFSGGEVNFHGAEFRGGTVRFTGARFSGGEVDFGGALFSGAQVSFDGTEFSGGRVDLAASFSGGQVSFHGAKFCGGRVSFVKGEPPSPVTVAEFSGGVVDFRLADDWSAPPRFPWDSPPPGVTLPAEDDRGRMPMTGDGVYSTRVSQHVSAPRSAVYGALLDAGALARWRVPAGMSSQVHEFDPREGGTFRISLTYDAPGKAGKSQARTDTYHGHFARLVPDRQVVEVFEFETADPRLSGLMTMTTTLTDSGGGTDVLVVHEGVPAAIPAADNETGTRMALANLAALVEAGIGP